MKNILITGASRGIGAATAFLAAELGFTIVVNYHKNKTAAEEIVDNILGTGGKARAVPADVTVQSEVISLFQEAEEYFGPIDALVNNAGILETQMRLEEMEAERLERIFKLNVVGQFLCAREAVKRMSTRHGGKGGAIVNVSSIASKTGSPGEYIDYAASKGAIDTMTVGLAKEVAGEGIRVNAVRPALIFTDIHAAGGDAGRVDRLQHSIPLGRGGYPKEVAEAILWLVSDKASFTTGSFIDVSGGI